MIVFQSEIDTKVKKGEEIQESLTKSFDSLEKANEGLNKEIKSHKYLYRIFLTSLIILIIILISLWSYAIFKHNSTIDLKYSDLLLYLSPSLILVGFICGCVVEINKLRRHLISLREMTRKFSIIKIALEGYYNVTDKLQRDSGKAQGAFERIMNEFIDYRINFDEKDTEHKKRDDKEKFVPQKAVEAALEILNNYIKKG